MSSQFSNQSPIDATPYAPPPKKSSGFRWLIGLLLVGLGILFVGGIVCIAGVCYVASNLDRWVVTLGREAIVAAINDSDLPQQEKGEVITQIDRIVSAYQERKINQSDLERIFTELQESPAMTALALSGLPDEILTGTGLSATEVEQGRQTLERAIRGVYEGKIKEDALYAALPGEPGEEPESDAGGVPSGDRVRLASTNSSPTSADDDLREALVKLKVMVDNAGIPNEPFQIDVSDEVQKLVDRALAGK